MSSTASVLLALALERAQGACSHFSARPDAVRHAVWPSKLGSGCCRLLASAFHSSTSSGDFFSIQASRRHASESGQPKRLEPCHDARVAPFGRPVLHASALLVPHTRVGPRRLASPDQPRSAKRIRKEERLKENYLQ